MTEEINSAEQTTQTAELSDEGQASTNVTEVDYEALYKEQAEKTAKAEQDARNFREGYEKWKGIAKRVEREKETEGQDNFDQTSDVSQLVQQEVQRALAETTAVQERKKLEELNMTMARELKEAKLALKNRSQVSMTAQGSGASSAEVQDRYLSPELIAEFKSKGKSDEWIQRFKETKRKQLGLLAYQGK